MKTRLLICLLVMMALVACGGNEAVEPQAEPTAVADVINTNTQEETIEPTDVPAEKLEPTEAPTEAPESTAIPTEEPEPTAVPTEEPAPTAEPAPDVPEVIDLAVLPGRDAYDNFHESNALTFTLVDGSGNETTMAFAVTVDLQRVPELTLVQELAGNPGEGAWETVLVNGNMYNFTPEFGCSIFAVDENVDPMSQLFTDEFAVTGEATLAEIGVEIDGILTDRYAITLENLVDADVTDAELSIASAYVARDGGYLLRLELVGTGSFEEGAEPGAFSLIKAFRPLTEPLVAIPPTGCLDEVANTDKYPLPDDATSVSSVNGEVSFSSPSNLDTILAFYRETLVAEGWTLADEVILGSFAYLDFTKDGVTLNVNAVQNGDVVWTTLSEE